MDWIYYVVLLIVLVAGLGLIVFNMPGLWLMAATAAVYALATGPEHYLWPWSLLIILGLCLLAEVLEFVARAGGSAKAGGSKRATILGIVGGIVGGIVLSIPVPILGTIAGVCIGAFAGAMLGQLTKHQDLEHSTRVGFGAAKGTLVGILLKLVIGCVIFLFAAWRALPIGGAPATQPQQQPPVIPTTLPATSPAVEAA
jgi:uncharacterized protein YqgC (DUF456 family)